MFLLTPGPSACLDEVYDILHEDILYHRSPEFSTIYFEAHELAKRIFQTQAGEVLLYNGSGTQGMDLSVASFFEPSDEVLVISIGNFGNRFIEICEHYQLHVHALHYAWGTSYDLKEVETCLEQNPKIKAIFVTHCETSTGVLNPIAPLGVLTKASERLLIVDTISGIVMNPFAMDDWGVDVAISASQKGFYMPPGLCLLALSPKAIAALKEEQGYYLGIARNLNFLKNKQIFTTVNTPYIKALHFALTYILDHGIDETQAFYASVHQTLKDGLIKLGYQPFLSQHESKSLLVMQEHEQVDTVAILKANGIQIGSGMQHLQGKVIRFGNMNKTSHEIVERVLVILEQAIKKGEQ
ncbi:MAG: pyridoxal-phosphate-dependent aminotransferase family protein [Erysipelotrichaceae bacterium]